MHKRKSNCNEEYATKSIVFVFICSLFEHIKIYVFDGIENVAIDVRVYVFSKSHTQKYELKMKKELAALWIALNVAMHSSV